MKHELVKLRFEVTTSPGAAPGTPAVDPTQTLEVDLASLEEADRQLLVRRMERDKGNVFDVCRLQWDGTKEFRRPTLQEGRKDFYASQFPVRVQTTEPTLESLLEAVKADYQRFKVR